MLQWLELLQSCYNVTGKRRTARASFGRASALENVRLTLQAARSGLGYSLIDWELV